jgi:tRNA (guanine37-N1)-methyltransferase
VLRLGVEVVLHDLRDYSLSKHRQVDDYAFGGGAGMVLSIEPIARCIRHLQSQRTYDEVIYMTPDGEPFNQRIANTLSLKGNLIFLCGHYKGVDQRVRDLFVTKEISIGDFVLSGGELAAAVCADAIIRLIPGVLNDETSALTDSFQDNLLAPPVYTRPAEFEDIRFQRYYYQVMKQKLLNGVLSRLLSEPNNVALIYWMTRFFNDPKKFSTTIAIQTMVITT